MPPAEIIAGLYLGDRRDAKDRASLRRLNIQSVVNCTPPKSEDPAAGCPSFFERELRYLRVPIYDSPAEDAAEHFAAVLDFISSRLHHGGVLVHCNRGVSRSATFVVRSSDEDAGAGPRLGARARARGSDRKQSRTKRSSSSSTYCRRSSRRPESSTRRG